ncbi:hypothetical protein IAT38_007257 [Cryptococcus sp. DSM 104549]
MFEDYVPLAPRPLSILPGPFAVRPLSRRGMPWDDKEKRELLFDGHGSSHEDGIMDFEAPARGYASLPPDVQAYFVLVHRLQSAGASMTDETLFKTPVELAEIESGASYLREAQSQTKGIFLDLERLLRNSPVEDPSKRPLWAQSLAPFVTLPFLPVGAMGQHIFTGCPPDRAVYLTNIRPAFPSYLNAALNWEDLLILTLKLYHQYYHPIALAISNRSTDQGMMESMIHCAVSWRDDLMDKELIRAMVEEYKEAEQQSDGSGGEDGSDSEDESGSDDGGDIMPHGFDSVVRNM